MLLDSLAPALAIASLLLAGYAVWLSWQFYKESRAQNDRVQDAVTRIEVVITSVQSNIDNIVQRAVSSWVGGAGGDQAQTELADDLRETLNEIHAKLKEVESNKNLPQIKELEQLIHNQQILTRSLITSARATRAESFLGGGVVKSPAVSVTQTPKVTDTRLQQGLITISVLRPVPIATGTGKFEPPMDELPANVVASLVSAPPEMRAHTAVRVGVGNTHDFNVHLNGEGIFLIPGEYVVEYEAKLNTKKK